jgi:hypothetical protein
MSGSIFAAKTEVSVEKTKTELERLLVKHGAAQYGTAHDDANGFAVVYFALEGRHIRLQVPIPKLDAWPDPKLDARQQPRGKKAPQRWSRWGEATRAGWVRQQWGQVCRTRWRCMLLIVKAKLELIGMQLSTVDREFLADITLPDGRSVYEWLKPGIEKAYLGGTMPRMLGVGSSVVDGEFKEVNEP